MIKPRLAAMVVVDVLMNTPIASSDVTPVDETKR